MCNKKRVVKNGSKTGQNGKEACGDSLTAATSTLSQPADCQGKQTPSSAAEPGPAQLTCRPTEADGSTKKSSLKTRITVKYDAGFPNQLYIRGSGADLSWEKGQLLKNVQPDEWVWETEHPCTAGEFKVLINDRFYETGDNHPLSSGTTLLYTPQFNG